jgi:nicotinate-nucleotide adenylyltransferase
MRRTGILGGTFDPIHCGHIDVARTAQGALGLTEIVVITSNVPPHRPATLASSYHRFAMAALAVSNRPGWRVSDMELQSADPSYTVTTLRRFRNEGYSADELFFLIGADAFAEIESWREYPHILELAHFAVVTRSGFKVAAPRGLSAELADRIVSIDAPTADVSSTVIRQRIAAGESIAGLVPPLVRQHIEQHGLYTSSRMHGQD